MKFKHLTIITFKLYEAEIPRFQFKSARTELPFSPRRSSQPFRAPRSPLGACCDITVSLGRALTSQAHTEPRNCDLTTAGSHARAPGRVKETHRSPALGPPLPRNPAPRTQLTRGGLARVVRLRAQGPAGRTTSGARPRGRRPEGRGGSTPSAATPRSPPPTPGPAAGSSGSRHGVRPPRALRPAPSPGPPVLKPGRGLARGCGSPMRRRQA